MASVRKGSQTPTRAFSLPYTSSKGESAVRLYAQTGRKAQTWQKLLLYDILAINNDELWTHTKYGFAVPRRNGKNEVLVMRELWGLRDGERILHTAHLTTTAHAAWERLMEAVEGTKMMIKSSYRAFGREHIEIEGGGIIEFRTRTSRGGLGEGFDLLIIDEAQEYLEEQETALKYIVTSSQNPQTIFTGTPPTAVSAGTVFQKMRKNVLAGTVKNSGWAEWSVEHETDPHDVDAWYLTNPSLGTIFTERSVEDEIGDDAMDFNIQRLGFWTERNLKSAISKREWEDLRITGVPDIKGPLFVGIKYGKASESVSMSVAAYTSESRIFLEAIDCRPIRAGTGWITDFLSRAQAVKKIVVDGANGQQTLADAMKAEKIKAPILPTVKDVIAANADFEQGIYQKKICHANQLSLTQSVSNVEKRAIGSNGGFGYRSIREGVDVTLVDASILAYWAAETTGEVRKTQKISY